MYYESSALKKVPTSLALKGIIADEHSYKLCDNVISHQSKFKFENTNLQKLKKQYVFYSEKKRDSIRKLFDSNAGSKSVVNIKEIEENINRIINDEIVDEKEEQDISYICIINFFVHSFVSSTIDIDDYQFNGKCVDELKALERCLQFLPECDKQNSCDVFFEKFGTHINKGPLSYGRVYMAIVNCYTDPINKDEVDDITRILKEMCIDDEGVFGDMKKEIVSNYQTVKEISIAIEWCGEELSTEMNLTALLKPLGKNIWQVIDFENKAGLIGLWDVLEYHKSYFIDVSAFCNALSDASIIFYWGRKKVIQILNAIKQYSNDPHLYINANNYLAYIINWKYEIEGKTKSERLWWKIFDSIEMKTFLKSVLDCNASFYLTDVFYIKSYISVILNQAYERIDNKVTHDLMNWIEDLPYFEINRHAASGYHLELFFADIRINILRCFEDDKDTQKSRAKAAFSHSIKHTTWALEILGCKEEITFLNLLLQTLQYDFDNKLFSSELTSELLDQFVKIYEKESVMFNQFMEEENDDVFFYLLDLALNSAQNNTDLSSAEEKFKKILKYIHLRGEAHMYTESYIEGINTWEKFRSIVRERLCGGHEVDTIMDDERLLLPIFSYNLDQNSTDSSTNEINNDSSDMNIIDELGLSKFYPNKLTIKDTRRNSMIDKIVTKVDIPWYFINSVISCDYKLWHNLTIPNTRNNEILHTGHFASLFGQTSSYNMEDMYHPLDVTVAIFLCCDNFLKQLLMVKLQICRLGIPFLLPDLTGNHVLQLWGITSISSPGQSFNSDASPVISFVRTNDLSISKTKFINLLLDKSHQTFFHKDLLEENIERKMSNGLISTSWYAPSNHKPLMFLNLRGSCKKQAEPLNVIMKLSDIIFVFIDIAKLDDEENNTVHQIRSRSKQIVLVFVKGEHSPFSNFKERYIDFIKSLKDKDGINVLSCYCNFEPSNGMIKQTNKLRKEVMDIINKLCACVIAISLEEQIESWISMDIKTDYGHNRTLTYGKENALEIYDLMKEYEISFLKDNIFPLQGNLLQQWGNIERERKTYRSKKMGVESQEHFMTRLNNDQTKLRNEQRTKFKEESNKIIKLICSRMINFDISSRKFFLYWIAFYLNELSRIKVKEYSDSLDETRQQLYNSKNNSYQENDDSDIISKKIVMLKKDIANVSLDVTNVFREVGQVYEAFVSSQNISNELRISLENIPRAMAELFLDGLIIEIFDSCARHVPITFIKSICNHLKEKMDGNIFVISVVGIQSSGKSTLLNAMFGTQFPTDAGLCTQGVHAQLIAMPDTMNSYESGYIMLLDTEGLRATGNKMNETSNSDDNELATLVIGMSDLTIINIKGESHSEMNDIFQIVIHTLLKIKSVNSNLQLMPKCIFVYHNVDADDASQKLRNSNYKLIDTLDEIVATGSSRFGIQDVSSFTKLIGFNIERDIKYFPNHWHGVPPMATVSNGYTSKAKEIKSFIMNELIPQRQYQLDIKDFSIRIDDLWQGILRENFVFSFRNCLEINAFIALDEKMNQIKWNLNEETISWLKGKYNQLRNLSINSETEKEIRDRIDKKYESAIKELDEFFKNSKEGRLLKGKEIYYNQLKTMKEEIIRKNIDTLREDIDVQNSKNVYGSKLADWKKEARYKAIEIAENKRLSKEELDEEELKYEFEKLWVDLKNTLPPISIHEENIDVTLENVFRNSIQIDMSLYEEQSKSEFLPLGENEFKTQHVNILKECLDFEQEIRILTLKIKNQIDLFLNEVQNRNFYGVYAERVIQIVISEVKEWNTKNNSLKLTDIYKMDTMITVEHYIKPKFKKMQENFKLKVYPKSEEKEFKQELKIRFSDTFTEIDLEQTTATIFSQSLKDLIKSNTEKYLFGIAYKSVKQNFKFMHSKNAFLVKVLQDLLMTRSFQEYMLYIQDTDNYLHKQFYSYIDQYIFSDKDISSRLNNKYRIILENVIKRLETIDRRMTESKDDIKLTDWMALFNQQMIHIFSNVCEKTKDLIDYSKESVFRVKDFHLFLHNSLLSGIDDEFCAIGQFDSVDERTFEPLASIIRGCNKKCPFCKACCLSSINNHANRCSTTLHFPIGVSGGRYMNCTVLSTHTCNSLIESGNRFCNEDTKNLRISMFQKILNYITYGDTMYEYDVLGFKDYHVVYDSWRINGDSSLETSLYWKWFIVTYKADLEVFYNASFTSIPTSWENITEQDAILSLNRV